MQIYKMGLTGFMILTLSQFSYAGGGGTINSETCVKIASEVLAERRLELLDKSGAIIVQVEYNATDCRNLKAGLRESVSLLVTAENPGQSHAKDFVFDTRIITGNPWIGEGSIRHVGGSGGMLNFCPNSKQGQAVNCSREFIAHQTTDDPSKIGDLRKSHYDVSIAGDQIPFVRISVPGI